MSQLLALSTSTTGGLELSTGWVAQNGFPGEDFTFFLMPTTISLMCETAGAGVFYTKDGRYPTPASGVLIDTAIPMPAVGTTVRAAAYKPGMNPGDVTQFTVISDS